MFAAEISLPAIMGFTPVNSYSNRAWKMPLETALIPGEALTLLENPKIILRMPFTYLPGAKIRT